MSQLSITPAAIVAGSGWTNLTNITDGNELTFASLDGSTENVIAFNEYYDLEDDSNLNIGNPEVTIDYITVACRVEVLVGASTLDFEVSLSSDSELASKTFTATTTEQVHTLYFDRSSLTNASFQRTDLRNNINFTVTITPQVTGVTASFYQLDTNVEYTESDYAQGSASTFPVQADTFVGVSNATSQISLNTNYVIQSDQLNRLSDSIITTQRTLRLEPGQLRALGSGLLTIGKDSQNNSDIFITSFVIKGTQYNEYFGRYYEMDGGLVEQDIDYTNIKSGQANIKSPVVDTTSYSAVKFSAVSGMGWVDNGGVRYPLYVNPQVQFWYDDGLNNAVYSVGFRSYPALAGTFDSDFSSTNTPEFDPYTGSASAYNVTGTASTFEVRILAIGKLE